MGELTSFRENVIEQVDYYVYLLVDPRDKTIFYVGKGSGNRVFQHELDASAEADDRFACNEKKIQRIREIHSVGLEVGRYLLRYGIDEDEAYRLEAAVIDLLTTDMFRSGQLLNKVSGHGSKIFGLQSVNVIEDSIATGELDVKNAPDRILCININNEYFRKGILNAVQGNWNLNKRRADKADYVLAELKGIVVGVYRIKGDGWKVERALEDKADKKRKWFSFEAEEVTDKVILDRYLHKRIKKSKGSKNPIRYSYK